MACHKHEDGHHHASLPSLSPGHPNLLTYIIVDVVVVVVSNSSGLRMQTEQCQPNHVRWGIRITWLTSVQGPFRYIRRVLLPCHQLDNDISGLHSTFKLRQPTSIDIICTLNSALTIFPY